jgi:hypothetical protein
MTAGWQCKLQQDFQVGCKVSVDVPRFLAGFMFAARQAVGQVAPLVGNGELQQDFQVRCDGASLIVAMVLCDASSFHVVSRAAVHSALCRE